MKINDAQLAKKFFEKKNKKETHATVLRHHTGMLIKRV